AVRAAAQHVQPGQRELSPRSGGGLLDGHAEPGEELDELAPRSVSRSVVAAQQRRELAELPAVELLCGRGSPPGEASYLAPPTAVALHGSFSHPADRRGRFPLEAVMTETRSVLVTDDDEDIRLLCRLYL